MQQHLPPTALRYNRDLSSPFPPTCGRPQLAGPWLLSTLSLLLLAIGIPARGHAQSVAGQVVDSLSGVGLGGGYVVLVDSAGREVDRTLSDQSGRFEVHAPAPGAYHVSARRIGFRPVTSPPITVAFGIPIRLTLRVRSVPITLSAVVIEGTPRCGDRGAEGSGVATVWQQVGEALAAVRWTATVPRYRYRLSLFERALDQFGHNVLRERRSSRSGYYQTPFQSAPPEELVRDGYVTGGTGNRTYFAPDAPVLLSDPFAATHCFSLVKNRRDTTLVGLAFEPTPDRRLPEIEGTLWVDRATAELESFQYSYVNLPVNLREDVAGGHADFLRLPSGAWIIQRWSIRNPIMRRTVSFEGAPVYSLAALQETGGEVLDITDRASERVYSAEVALLEGMVFDSLANTPLAGATVRVGGTDLAATTDAGGHFELWQPLQGRYELTFDHPALDSVGYTPRAERVALTPGDRTTVLLATPSESSIAATLCAGRPLREDQGVLLGSVRDEATGRPRRGVRVSATWYDYNITAAGVSTRGHGQELSTDSSGTYLFCDVPADSRVVLELDTPTGAVTQALRVEPHRSTVGRREYPLRAGRIWWRDLIVGEAAPAALVATVTDTLGQALANAVVRLLGTPFVGVTDRAGEIALRDVPSGSGVLAVRRLGYRPVDRTMELPPGDTLRLAAGDLALAPLPVLLDTAVVTGTAEDRVLALAGFYKRRNEGFGDFITRQEFDKYAPQNMYDIARHLPVLDVRPNPNYYRTFGATSAQGAVDARPYLLRSRRQTRTQCAVQIYLDGTFIGTDETTQIDAILEVNQIEAVEAYAGGADVPPQFNATGSECGVIAIWTRR